MVTGIIRLLRAGNLLLIALTQVLVQLLVIEPLLRQAQLEPTLSAMLLLLLVAATVLIAAGGYIINDYFDVKVDVVNRPSRVVVDRSVPRRQALLLHQLVTWTGIVLAAVVSWKVANFKLTFIFLLAAAMLWLYSAAYKRKVLAGNLVVALLTALVVVLPALFERQLFYPPSEPGRQAARAILIIIFFYFLFAFLVSLAREWVKDLQDMEGDRRYGSRTLPLLWGPHRVQRLAAAVLLVVMTVIGLIQWMQVSGGDLASAFVLLVMLQLPLAAVIYWLLAAGRERRYRAVSSLLKWILLMGVLTMVYFYLVTLPV